MKNYLLLFGFWAVVASVFGQSDSVRVRKCHHIVGVDVVSFIQYLRYTSGNNDLGSFEFFLPKYQLTYRLAFGRASIRAGFGGYFISENDDPNPPIPGTALKRVDRQFDWRIGWEFSNRVARRFVAFYGIDFKQGSELYRNDNWNRSTGYVNGLKMVNSYKGLAALYGIRFLWTKRISLTTSMDYSFYYEKKVRINYFTPISNQFSQLPDVPDPKRDKRFSQFGPPLMLNLDISF